MMLMMLSITSINMAVHTLIPLLQKMVSPNESKFVINMSARR